MIEVEIKLTLTSFTILAVIETLLALEKDGKIEQIKEVLVYKTKTPRASGL